MPATQKVTVDPRINSTQHSDFRVEMPVPIPVTLVSPGTLNIQGAALLQIANTLDNIYELLDEINTKFETIL